jgi:hypothetical protein
MGNQAMAAGSLLIADRQSSHRRWATCSWPMGNQAMAAGSLLIADRQSSHRRWATCSWSMGNQAMAAGNLLIADRQSSHRRWQLAHAGSAITPSRMSNRMTSMTKRLTVDG